MCRHTHIYETQTYTHYLKRKDIKGERKKNKIEPALLVFCLQLGFQKCNCSSVGTCCPQTGMDIHMSKFLIWK